MYEHLTNEELIQLLDRCDRQLNSGLKSDIKYALSVLRDLSETGYGVAQYFLAGVLYAGRVVKQDYSSAFEWMYRAAMSGYPLAECGYGDYLAGGIGTECNTAEAYYWYNKAAQDGSTQAMNCLSQWYREGIYVDTDAEKSFSYDLMAAMYGDGEAMFNTGLDYVYGYGVEENIEEGYKWIDFAAAEGIVGANVLMGHRYLDELGDGAGSYPYFQRGALFGDVHCIYVLHQLTMLGEGTQKNPIAAYELCMQAAQLGDRDAICDIGYYFESGTVVDQDYKKAALWYQKAVDLGLPLAMNNLGLLYANGKGMRKNMKRALDLFEQSAAQANADGMYYYGLGFLDGVGGRKQDFRMAKKYFEQSAQMGNGDAMSDLGILYEEGQGVKKNPRLAYRWYKRAADAGCSLAKRNLAHCYLWGLGCKMNFKKCRYWLSEAAKDGLDDNGILRCLEEKEKNIR